MNVDEIFSVPDVSFRLAFPSKFNQKGAVQSHEVCMAYHDLWEFMNDPQATQPQVLSNARQTIVFPPQGRHFVQQIRSKVEKQVFNAITEYETTYNSTATLNTRQVNGNFPEKLKAEPPRIYLGKSADALSIGEAAQREINRVTDAANRLKEIIRKQDLTMQELPEEAAQFWVELHTIPGAMPSNTSDLEWSIKVLVTCKRADEELCHTTRA
jgi:hypothetical protein